MNEEQVESRDPGIQPMVEDVVQSTTKRSSSEAENTSVAEPAQAPSDMNEEATTTQAKEEDKAPGGEPLVDWFEPLEDDDEANSFDRNDPDEESLAGESEKTESVAGSEKVGKKIYQLKRPPRKRTHPDEGWEEWPTLGDGWKRKEVVRQSGSSIGQKDVYYLSPRGDRVRSRVELISVMVGVDLSTFEYKAGRFHDGEPQPLRVRVRVKKKVREHSSSESSWVDRGEGADTPDSNHRLTPSLGPKAQPSNQGPKAQPSNQAYLSWLSTFEAPNQSSRSEDPGPSEHTIRLPITTTSRAIPIPLPAINGDNGTEGSPLVCSKCGISFIGTWYDKQRKRPSCPSCWASRTREHPMVRFRKWIPCGQCVGCHNSLNCGQCANCKHGKNSPESRRRICRKRKCICPIRKGPGSFAQPKSYDLPEAFDDSISLQSEVADSQHPSLRNSDTENYSVNVDVDDDDDMSTDDDDDKEQGGEGGEECTDSHAGASQTEQGESSSQQGSGQRAGSSTDHQPEASQWVKKRKRRACGQCKACLQQDCGRCDFCKDKPKFGGSNKKRQKCRLRQCRRQAMRHLLPSKSGQGGHVTGPRSRLLGRPRPHYTYSRKSNFKRQRGLPPGADFSDNEDEDSNLNTIHWSSEPPSGSKLSFEYELNVRQQADMQLNRLDFEQQNGMTDRVPHFGNYNNIEKDQPSRWDPERSRAGRDARRHGDEDEYEDDDYEEEEEEEEEMEEEEELPMITQIFSLSDHAAGMGVDMENQLMKLLHSLRSSILPILWYAIMVEGPQLQLIQCSKQSSMTDTMVLIDPGFCYQVTVQKQPLLPTHPLYDKYPARLTSENEVVNLLLGLESYMVCPGLAPKKPLSDQDPLILERASTCDFLVQKNVSVCTNCRALQ